MNAYGRSASRFTIIETQPANVATTNQIDCFRSSTVGSSYIARDALKRMTNPRNVSEMTIKLMKTPAGGIRNKEFRETVRALTLYGYVREV